MTRSAKITREMIVEAGFALARREGAERLNARSVAAELGCSTQPVMARFATMDALREAVYARADEFHSEYLMTPEPDADPMLSIGLRYVRFGAEETRLFRFLFQSNQYARMDVRQLLASYDAQLAPIYGALSAASGCGPAACRQLFAQLFITAHGLASLLANNAMSFDADYCAGLLRAAFVGGIKCLEGESDHEEVLRKE